MTSPSPRRILHCDMDCFYAAVHVRDDPTLRGKPVIVGGSPTGRGVVAAASYEARRFGIHSAMPAARAVRLCPNAVFLRPDFPRYRAESEKVFAILREMTPIVQPASLDEAYLDVTEHLAPWGHATGVAQEIRRRVRIERGLTISVGVAPNRLLAKIASDVDKPDGLTVVRPDRIQEFLDPMPVRRLHGVGPATERILHELGAHSVAELRALSREALEKRLGKHGRALFRYARGEDDRSVHVHHERKSLGHERTFETDLSTLEEMDAQIDRLAEMVGRGLQKRDLRAKTVTVKVRYPDFETPTRSRTLRTPTRSAEWIAEVGRDLLRQTKAGREPVRLLGVTASGFESRQHGPEQLRLFESSEVAQASGDTDRLDRDLASLEEL